MSRRTRTLAVFGAWVICLALLWMGASSNGGRNKTEPNCAQVWEKYGEEKGAECYDIQHLKEKLINDEGK